MTNQNNDDRRAPAPGHTGFSRRSFMGAGLASAAVLATGSAASAQPRRTSTKRPRNVILMISDGMSPGVLQLGEHFAQQQRGTSSAWMDLTHADRARTTMMSTYSANGPVTDSAAAGTAFSTGQRTNNGALCVLPNGQRPTPLGRRLKAAGRATGLVTTTQLAHATPASFIVNHPSRHDYKPIAAQMLAMRPDVMLGGGTDHFTDAQIKTHAPDATVLRTRSDLRAGLPDDGAVMGFFTPDHMSYELDRLDDEPTIAEMTSAAIGRLSQDPAGFFLMVEGGRVDHAAHACDILSLLHDQLAFDDALRAAWEFAEHDGETLLVVTSDHANANPGITHYAEKGARGFARLKDGTMSFGALVRAAGGRSASIDAFAVAVQQHRSLTLTDHDRTALARLKNDELANPFEDLDNRVGVFGSVFANHYAVAFCSTSHTSDHVVLSATGPGHEGLPQFRHITDLHTFLAGALGLG